MPTVAQALPELQSLLDEITAEPLTPEAADGLIDIFKQVSAASIDDQLETLVDPLFRLAEARETRAFVPVCEFLSLIEPGGYQVDFGTVVTELLSGILVNIFDGNTESLATLVLAREVDDYVRSSALSAMVRLTLSGAIERSDTERVIVALPQTSPDAESVLWHSWPIAVSILKLHELAPMIERALSGSDIVEAEETLAKFRIDMAPRSGTVDVDDTPEFPPFTTAAAARGRLRDLTDMFDKLIRLITESRADDQAGRTVRRALVQQEYGNLAVETVTNDYRHIGRNDPCPCGSGKKHKKCCLN